MKKFKNNTIVLATHNNHKTIEISQILSNFEVKSLNQISFTQEIEENGKTFQENAEIKARTVYNSIEDKNTIVIADDSGLVIPALSGAPGIYSARYAGTGNSEDNIKKVLNELADSDDRNAYFIAVICLILNDKAYFFEGKVHGTILYKEDGVGGFGYDPIFKPNKYNKSFASITPDEKNKISHRFIALQKMKEFLK